MRRIVVGQLGTGNIERRFSEAANKIFKNGEWEFIKKDLADLNPQKEEFVDRLFKRSFNKRTLSFMRRSILLNSLTPNNFGFLHFIWTDTAQDWTGFEDEASFWGGTIGNSYLSTEKQRNINADHWEGFKKYMLDEGIAEEQKPSFLKFDNWNPNSVSKIGKALAKSGGDIWYSV